MFGSSDWATYKDVLKYVISDIEKLQLSLYRDSKTDEANTLQLAIDICKKHIDTNYC
jgi:hypothetical protein